MEAYEIEKRYQSKLFMMLLFFFAKWTKPMFKQHIEHINESLKALILFLSQIYV